MRVRAATAVSVVVLVVHALALSQQAVTDDDDFYIPAGIRYVSWVTGEAATIDAAFSANHEHPPVAKYAFGVAHRLLSSTIGGLDAARMGTVFLTALMTWVLIMWLWRRISPAVAVLSPLLLLSLPRFFLHSEVATLDVPVACMMVIACAAFDWAGDSVHRGVVAGVVFGIALATKLNAPFALVACVVVVVLQRWRQVSVDASLPSASVTLPRVPPSLFAMLVLGPLVFVVLWPWLWPDLVARLSAYFAFHLKHYPIYLFFDGVIWERPFAPAKATLIMAAGTVPIMFVAALSVGTAVAVRAVVRFARGTEHTAQTRTLTLVLLQAVVAIATVAVPDVPRYGGEKLFMPFFPFASILAAVGVVRIAAALTRRRGAVVVVAALTMAPGLKGISDTWGGFALSYYGEGVGGLRGAVARGYERTYYDMADRRLARFLDDNARGLKVHVEPNHKEYVRTWRWLRRSGVIGAEGFLIEADLTKADVVVLTHERRWRTYPTLREQVREWPLLAEQRVFGVPLWTVYRRPSP